MLTRWHKTFHILVFGAIAVLAFIVVLLKQDFHARFEGGNERDADFLVRSAAPPDTHTNDRYGGSTPEETFLLFLAALQSDDARLASRYFVAAKQREWEESLSEIKKIGGMATMYAELALIPQDWVKTDASASAGIAIYAYGDAKRITFVKSEESGTWKIAQL